MSAACMSLLRSFCDTMVGERLRAVAADSEVPGFRIYNSTFELRSPLSCVRLIRSLYARAANLRPPPRASRLPQSERQFLIGTRTPARVALRKASLSWGVSPGATMPGAGDRGAGDRGAPRLYCASRLRLCISHVTTTYWDYIGSSRVWKNTTPHPLSPGDPWPPLV